MLPHDPLPQVQAENQTAVAVGQAIFDRDLRFVEVNDVKVGDRIECYRTEEVARTLESAPQG